MSPIVYRIIMLGVPILVLVIGVFGLIWLVRSNITASRRSQKSVNGLLFKHPDNGGGHKLMMYNTALKRPSLRPYWYRENWLSPLVPFYFFYEDKVVMRPPPLPSEKYLCSCGYEGADSRQLHAHQMWSSRRTLPQDEWLAKHQKVISVVEPVSVEPVISYEIKPYNPDDEPTPIMTPYGIYDINAWDCQRDFLVVKKKWKEVLQLGAGVAMVGICLLAIIVLGGEIGRDRAERAQISKPNAVNTQVQK